MHLKRQSGMHLISQTHSANMFRFRVCRLREGEDGNKSKREQIRLVACN